MNLQSINLENIKNITTEEATKTALILPFINQLGYNVFDINEVIPEFTADIAKRNGEKVDFAIKVNNQISIIIETKDVREQLDKHTKQLSRYFVNTEAKIGILTNGLEYWFFTDLEKDNIMDDVPFFKFDIRKYEDKDIEQLKEFSKNNFDATKLYGRAEKLRVLKGVANCIVDEFRNPTDDFTKAIMNSVYDGVKTQAVVNEYREYIKDSYINIMNLEMMKRMFPDQNIELEAEDATEKKESKRIIETTENELAVYNFIQTILIKNEGFEVDRISWKDNASYFNILVDNKVTKWIIRVFDKKDLKVTINIGGKEQSYVLVNTFDIFKYEEEILQAYNLRINKKKSD